MEASTEKIGSLLHSLNNVKVGDLFLLERDELLAQQKVISLYLRFIESICLMKSGGGYCK